MNLGHCTGIATALVTGAVLLPGVATAQNGAIPPVPLDASQGCAGIKATFRMSVTEANAAKRSAYAAAWDAWAAGVTDEKRTLATQLAAADTKGEIRRAKRAWRIGTADERAALLSARKRAGAKHKAAIKQAQAIFRAQWRTCH